MKNTNLWGGRFEKSLTDIAADYNASIGFDNILYPFSIQASKAHAQMLAEQGIISNEDNDKIQYGLDLVKQKLDKGQVQFNAIDEDIMMVIEKELTAIIGESGKRLHTARSRNDQNKVDEILYLRYQLDVTLDYLKGLLEMLVKKAEEQQEIIMPGFTHFQHAQPITVGFYYMAHFQGLRRDYERLKESRKRINVNPLGSCALAGTTLPTNRFRTTELLGFDSPSENALDAIGSRDNFAEYLFNAALTMTHLSGFAEEIIVFNTQEFSFIDIDDSYCTGSSIMPQKKNPDIAELVRGKVSRTIGNLMSLFTMLKGTALTLNKDYQEDKEALFDSIHTLQQTLLVFAGMLDNIKFRPEVLAKQLEKGFIEATDVAETLVTKGVPFRTAHEMVGTLVKICEKSDKRLCQATDPDLEAAGINPELLDMSEFTVENCIKNRKSYGGTSFQDVQRQITNAKAFLSTI